MSAINPCEPFGVSFSPSIIAPSKPLRVIVAPLDPEFLLPEKRIYFHRDPNPDRRQPHSELDIHTTLKGDIYSVFSSIDTDNGIAFFQIMINPLVQFVWYGGYMLVLGTLIALWPSKREKLLT